MDCCSLEGTQTSQEPYGPCISTTVSHVAVSFLCLYPLAIASWILVAILFPEARYCDCKDGLMNLMHAAIKHCSLC